ncbi:hypothetical protein D3C78_1636700 [compost metagenome]
MPEDGQVAFLRFGVHRHYQNEAVQAIWVSVVVLDHSEDDMPELHVDRVACTHHLSFKADDRFAHRDLPCTEKLDERLTGVNEVVELFAFFSRQLTLEFTLNQLS